MNCINLMLLEAKALNAEMRLFKLMNDKRLNLNNLVLMINVSCRQIR